MTLQQAIGSLVRHIISPSEIGRPFEEDGRLYRWEWVEKTGTELAHELLESGTLGVGSLLPPYGLTECTAVSTQKLVKVDLGPAQLR